MRISGQITNFKDLFSEIFYDWGFTSRESPQIHKDTNGYWINKTSLRRDGDLFWLNYKTESWQVSSLVFECFSKFYELYEGDDELERVLDEISDVWSHDLIIVKTVNGFSIKEFSVGKLNEEYRVFTKSDSFIIKDSTYFKLLKMYHYWSTI